MDSEFHGFRVNPKSRIHWIIKLGGVMGKLKVMWKDLSKPGKVFVAALVVIFAVILVNYIV
jgi:hypothetical protein